MIQHRFGSGSYNLRESEDIPPPLPATAETHPKHTSLPSTSNLNPSGALKKKVNFLTNGSGTESKVQSSTSLAPAPTQNYVCTVYFLDDTEKEFQIQKNAIGEVLINKVFDHLELIERDFFGLQFVSLLDNNSARMRWLDAKKNIKRQIICPPFHFYFRVKFYVSDPGRLIEEYTRYHVYLQLRRDLLDGKLVSEQEASTSTGLEVAALLGSYALQSELGDYCPEEHDSLDYLRGFQLLPVQSMALLQRIAHLHKFHNGQSPADAEFHFLLEAKRLPLYGFDVYDAKDGTHHPIMVGVNCAGVSVFESRRIVNSFPWAAIVKLSFKRKTFLLRIKTVDSKNEEIDTELSFNALSPQNCKMLWKSCIEHHTFFRLIAPPALPNKKLFHLGSKFRYSGRTEFQTIQDMKRRQHKLGQPHSPSELERRRQSSSSVGGVSQDSCSTNESPADFHPGHFQREFPHQKMAHGFSENSPNFGRQTQSAMCDSDFDPGRFYSPDDVLSANLGAEMMWSLYFVQVLDLKCNQVDQTQPLTRPNYRLRSHSARHPNPDIQSMPSNALPASMLNSTTSTATTSGISTSSTMGLSVTTRDLDESFGLVEYSLIDAVTPEPTQYGQASGSGPAQLEALESLLRSVSCSGSKSPSPEALSETSEQPDTSESEEFIGGQNLENCSGNCSGNSSNRDCVPAKNFTEAGQGFAESAAPIQMINPVSARNSCTLIAVGFLLDTPQQLANPLFID
ncbi:FERM central domain-containing protein [Ditylenchus destructor]|uniref:FERM central domain-containing protein n=1 Tax=Ditylenchus destructor TaxID=166010 RepID=A0AAD4QV87_9BILA|nr:FERM central domain-containing protein [Ditylenchus destructor]